MQQGLQIGVPVFHRLMRSCTDPVNLGPRPHLKHAAEVIRTQAPWVMHEHFFLPRHNSFDQLCYEEAHGLWVIQAVEGEGVEERCDADIRGFLR